MRYIARRWTPERELLHAPRLWPEYHAGYYGVFLRDLDGNNVEAVNHFSTRGSRLRMFEPPVGSIGCGEARLS